MTEKILRLTVKWISKLLFYIAIAIPILLLGMAIAQEYNGFFIFNYDKWFFFSLLLGVGVLIIGFRFLDIYINDNPDDFASLCTEIRFQLFEAKNAWIFGFGSALIVASIYLLFSSKNNLYSRYDTIFTIYVTILAITLGSRILYKNNAPIVGANDLLDRMKTDLKHNMDKNPRIWFVYIAPNVGFYRNYLRYPEIYSNGMVEIDDIRNSYKDFYFMLEKVIKRKPKELGMITYEASEFRNIYKVYDTAIDESEKKHIAEAERLNSAENSAKELLNLFRNAPKLRQEDVIVWEVPKNYIFPAPVFIIDDIVYYNSSYGLPTYLMRKNNQHNGTFHMIKGEKGYAELITWRYKDPILASAIVAHLKKMKEEFEKTN